jgi:hypothetical protein
VNKLKGLVKLPERITLTSRDPVNLPVPSSELLALHATCAKVAQFSGANAHIDGLDDDLETLGALVGDGGPADILANAIMMQMSTTHVDA